MDLYILHLFFGSIFPLHYFYCYNSCYLSCTTYLERYFGFRRNNNSSNNNYGRLSSKGSYVAISLTFAEVHP
jgi:hypothetical protein